MSKLSQAPLIEVAVALRWGVLSEADGSHATFSFDPDEARFFPGYFGVFAAEAGFGHVEHIDPDLEDLPHVATIQFRRGEDEWPCYQIGLGILTINQVNSGYDWETYKLDVMKGLEILKRSYLWGVDSLPLVNVELSYRDGFVIGPGETSLSFLKHNLRFDFSPPDALLSDRRVERELQGIDFSFELPLAEPPGVLAFSLQEGTINGQPGFAMDTSVQSSGEVVSVVGDAFSSWLESAHDIQRHAFKTVIDPAYARRFE